MDGSQSSVKILSCVLHHIDPDKNVVTPIQISASTNDLQDYLKGLLHEISRQEQKRSYRFRSLTTEFARCIDEFVNDNDLESSHYSLALAKRLLDEEISSSNRHKNINPITKGSFLQFIFDNGSSQYYLGVKIEHQGFIDANDLIRKSGLAENRKLYKAVEVELRKPNLTSEVSVFDTNGNPAVYWWNHFLELGVARDDRENTKTAVTSVISLLGTLKRKFPADYSILKNSTVAAFKQKTEMRFANFVSDVFEKYQPVEPAADPTIQALLPKLRKLPAEKGFDTQFSLDPASVPFRQRKYQLTSEITLSIQEGISNLTDKIWAERTSDGKNVLVIETNEVKDFVFKTRK